LAQKTGKEPTALLAIWFSKARRQHRRSDQATERVLLVTRFWYIRTVNPQTMQVTGLTRDGLFLMKGEVTQPLMNFRFNESPVRLCKHHEAGSQRARSGKPKAAA